MISLMDSARVPIRPNICSIRFISVEANLNKFKNRKFLNSSTFLIIMFAAHFGQCLNMIGFGFKESK